mgnify:CR=1 FL=1
MKKISDRMGQSGIIVSVKPQKASNKKLYPDTIANEQKGLLVSTTAAIAIENGRKADLKKIIIDMANRVLSDELVGKINKKIFRVKSK